MHCSLQNSQFWNYMVQIFNLILNLQILIKQLLIEFDLFPCPQVRNAHEKPH